MPSRCGPQKARTAVSDGAVQTGAAYSMMQKLEIDIAAAKKVAETTAVGTRERVPPRPPPPAPPPASVAYSAISEDLPCDVHGVSKCRDTRVTMSYSGYQEFIFRKFTPIASQ